jgi:tetratricopeptide (TPR) repeat protein
MATEIEKTPPEPKTADDFLRKGWLQHAGEKLHSSAEESFRRAISLSPNMVDAHYALGLALKAQGRRAEAIQSFEKVVSLLSAGVLEDHVRATMLRRLALGHTNQLKIGDWALEAEIWKKGK